MVKHFNKENLQVWIYIDIRLITILGPHKNTHKDMLHFCEGPATCPNSRNYQAPAFEPTATSIMQVYCNFCTSLPVVPKVVRRAPVQEKNSPFRPVNREALKNFTASEFVHPSVCRFCCRPLHRRQKQNGPNERDPTLCAKCA
jgi:hypothetical protein